MPVTKVFHRLIATALVLVISAIGALAANTCPKPRDMAQGIYFKARGAHGERFTEQFKTGPERGTIVQTHQTEWRDSRTILKIVSAKGVFPLSKRILQQREKSTEGVEFRYPSATPQTLPLKPNTRFNLAVEERVIGNSANAVRRSLEYEITLGRKRTRRIGGCPFGVIELTKHQGSKGGATYEYETYWYLPEYQVGLFVKGGNSTLSYSVTYTAVARTADVE